MNTRKWKRVLALFLTIILMACGNGVLTAYGEENKEADGVQEDILIQAPAGILIEADTGTVLYKKSEEEKRSPASITKINRCRTNENVWSVSPEESPRDGTSDL